jgi:hypothetical protein
MTSLLKPSPTVRSQLHTGYLENTLGTCFTSFCLVPHDVRVIYHDEVRLSTPMQLEPFRPQLSGYTQKAIAGRGTDQAHWARTDVVILLGAPLA